VDTENEIFLDIEREIAKEVDELTTQVVISNFTPSKSRITSWVMLSADANLAFSANIWKRKVKTN